MHWTEQRPVALVCLMWTPSILRHLRTRRTGWLTRVEQAYLEGGERMNYLHNPIVDSRPHPAPPKPVQGRHRAVRARAPEGKRQPGTSPLSTSTGLLGLRCLLPPSHVRNTTARRTLCPLGAEVRGHPICTDARRIVRNARRHRSEHTRIVPRRYRRPSTNHRTRQ